MSPFFVSCLWCVLQISLLCGAGVAISLLIARRYAASSAAVMSATAGAILVATLLVPIQIPHWALPQVHRVEGIAESPVSPKPAASETVTNTDSSGGAMVDFGALLAGLRTATNPATTFDKSPSFAVKWVTAVVAMGILVGLLRLGCAFYAVWQIRRGCVSIDGKLADCELKDLARTMNCRLSVSVATSNAIDSAAVIGWLRPLVVLPTDWKSWPLEQLRAVLAHELAHIARRDYLWRTVGTIARAVHYYHPLAHWLLGRLTVSQEIAADQLAAQTLGSRSKYLKALSHLAIRQDDQLHSEPILLPTSSSHLIRRIKMLRTKERTQSRGLNFIVRTVAVCTVLMLAVVTTALRGLAEPTDEQPTTLAAQTEGVQNSTEELFKYPPIDPAIIGDNEHGIFVLRVGEILKRDSIKPMIRGLNQAASAACKMLFTSPELPNIDLKLIDYVVGQTQFKIERRKRTPTNKYSTLQSWGSNYWVVRFNCDISSWKQWIRKNVPTAEELQHGGITYFQFPTIPRLGPIGLRVAARDSHTLVFALDGENFWEQVEATNTVRARWANEWNQLDGGLLSLVATDKSIEASIEESNSPESLALNNVIDNIQQFGYSVDWNDLTDQACVKIDFSSSSPEEAELLEAGIYSVLSLGEAKINGESDGDDSISSAAQGKRGSEMLNSFKTRTTTKPDGTVIVHFETSFTWSLAGILRELLPDEEEIASREHAKRAVK